MVFRVDGTFESFVSSFCKDTKKLAERKKDFLKLFAELSREKGILEAELSPEQKLFLVFSVGRESFEAGLWLACKLVFPDLPAGAGKVVVLAEDTPPPTSKAVVKDNIVEGELQPLRSPYLDLANLFVLRSVRKAGEVDRKLAEERLRLIATACAGWAQGGLEKALAYAHEREQGGRKIIDWLPVRKMLNRSKANIVSLCLVSLHHPQPDIILTLLERLCNETSSDIVQVFGGYGYMRDFEVEKVFRDLHFIFSLVKSEYE